MLEVGRLYKESSRGENKKYMQRVIAKKRSSQHRRRRRKGFLSTGWMLK
jgi:hypothetical protein